jgi:hypothetical protein
MYSSNILLIKVAPIRQIKQILVGVLIMAIGQRAAIYGLELQLLIVIIQLNILILIVTAVGRLRRMVFPNLVKELMALMN